MPSSRILRISGLLLGLVWFFNSHAQTLALTSSEQRWLDEHPVIRIAPDPDFAPFEWIDEQGRYKGISADYISLIEKKLGIKFKVIETANWAQIILLAQERKVDVLPALAATKQRETYLAFTRPYHSVPGVVVANRQYASIEALRGKKVAVVSRYYWDDVLSERETGIRIQRVDDTQFGIELASMGAVDAMVTDLASATSVINQTGINNLYIVNDPEKKLGSLAHAMAVRNDWPELHSIMDKALADISTEESEQIRAKWINIQTPPLWLNRTLLLSLFGSFMLILIVFSGFLIWNRTLKRKVERRTYELHTAQEHLMQAEKMESIGRLAAGIAHEVKNPLAIIRMGMDYLTPEIPQNPTNAEIVKDINDAVERAAIVIHGLLDFSRDKQLTLVSSDMNEVIQSALHLVHHELHQRNIQVQLSFSDKLPRMDMDANKMQQVFINLFMNALHAMDQDGTLEISSKLISDGKNGAPGKPGLRHENASIFIEFADTGPGIPSQDQANIFELFYTTKAVGEGTGLGLSVTRNIIKLHHGTISIKNRPQGGASVVMLFSTNK